MYRMDITIVIGDSLSNADRMMMLHTLMNEIQPALVDLTEIPVHTTSEHPLAHYTISGKRFSFVPTEDYIDPFEAEPVEPPEKPKRQSRRKKTEEPSTAE